MAKFEVELIIRETLHYLVEAANPEAAKEAAREQWEAGEPPDQRGDEAPEIDSARVVARVHLNGEVDHSVEEAR